MAVSSWQWLWDFEDRARRDGDAARVRLATYYEVAERIPHDLPDEQMAIYEAARALAIQLGERWCELFYEHWVIEVLIFGKQQPRRALDRAVRAVLETSKPEFAAFPQRLDLQMNLAAAYSGIDPIGYESELRALFAHIEASCDQFCDGRVYYAQLWGYFLEQIEDLGAVDAAYRYLEAAEESGEDHYISDALDLLCVVLVEFDPENARLQLRDLAATGEAIARREGRNRNIAAFSMWRALAARWDGQEREAQRFYRRAMTLQGRLPPPRNSAHYGAMEFHLAGGEIGKALQICQAEIRIFHSHELLFFLAERRLKKCRLLHQLGRDISPEAKRLRRVAAKLRLGRHWEERLAELKASQSGETHEQ